MSLFDVPEAVLETRPPDVRIQVSDNGFGLC